MSKKWRDAKAKSGTTYTQFLDPFGLEFVSGDLCYKFRRSSLRRTRYLPVHKTEPEELMDWLNKVWAEEVEDCDLSSGF